MIRSAGTSSPLLLVGVSGSLRAGSLNRRLLEAAALELPPPARLVMLEIADLPLYDEDLDGDGAPASVTAFKDAIRVADGVVLVTPEYNYGIPGPLKNALDWASRPAYRSVFREKPVTLMGAGVTPVATARAQAHLKLVLLSMLAAVHPSKEFGVRADADSFTRDGRLTDPALRERLRDRMESFVDWVARVGRAAHSGSRPAVATPPRSSD